MLDFSTQFDLSAAKRKDLLNVGLLVAVLVTLWQLFKLIASRKALARRILDEHG